MSRNKTEEKRLEILEAAARIFSTRDFHDVLVDRVAEGAGVGKGTIYRYFATKDDLYFAAVLHGFDGLARALSAAPGADQDPVRRLESIAHEVIDFFAARGDLSKLLMEDERRFETRQEELDKRRRTLQRLVEECLSDGVASGVFAISDIPAAATCFRGMIRSVLDSRVPGDSRDALAAGILDIFLHGVSRRPA